VIQPGAQRDITGSIEILFQPQKLFRRGAGDSGVTLENGAQE
jgi:hypothetical protein